MNSITLDDFVGIFNVGQKSSVYVQSMMDSLIDIYKDEYLSKLFGKTLFEDYKDNMSDSKYDDINDVLNGDKSPMIAYIYFHYLNQNQSFSTGTGQRRANNANSEPTPSAYRAIDTWNIVANGTRSIRRLVYNNDHLRAIANPNEMDFYLTNTLNPFDL